MTPRSVVDTVAKGELLGPLTLDVLYKTGHSRLPVIDSDIDHVVGILYVQDLLVVGEKKTPTAAEAMDSKVFYIREDQTLQHALGAFLKTRHHLFVVVNEYRETVGVVSLEDVIEALIGTKINDEFDAHDDLRKVAERNPAANNQPKNRTDV
jgi:CBS domain containing-hemolysin-like protein